MAADGATGASCRDPNPRLGQIACSIVLFNVREAFLSELIVDLVLRRGATHSSRPVRGGSRDGGMVLSRSRVGLGVRRSQLGTNLAPVCNLTKLLC